MTGQTPALWPTAHQAIMAGQAPVFVGARYQCPVCGRPYAELAAKKAHVKAKHPGGKRGADRD